MESVNPQHRLRICKVLTREYEYISPAVLSKEEIQTLLDCFKSTVRDLLTYILVENRNEPCEHPDSIAIRATSFGRGATEKVSEVLKNRPIGGKYLRLCYLKGSGFPFRYQLWQVRYKNSLNES